MRRRLSRRAKRAIRRSGMRMHKMNRRTHRGGTRL